jgi:hypothetical protein
MYSLILLALLLGAPHSLILNHHHIVIGNGIITTQLSGPPVGYQWLSNQEVTPEISQIAKQLLNGAMGTQTPFCIDGKHYMARVERHFHPYPPPNATPAEKTHYPKPWGKHRGVTIYKAIVILY